MARQISAVESVRRTRYEVYCAGMALATLMSVKGMQYGTPVTTDSLLRIAEADCDSAAV